MLYGVYNDGNVIKWNLSSLIISSTNNNNSLTLKTTTTKLPQLTPTPFTKQSLKFANKAISSNGNIMVQIYGDKKIKLMRLNDYE